MISRKWALSLSLLAPAALPAGLPVAVSLPVKELDTLSLYLSGETVLSLLVLPFAGLEAAFHKNEAAFGQILGAVFGGLLEDNDLVPFRFVDLVPVAVGVGLIGSDGHVADGGPCLRVAKFRVAPKSSDDHGLIQHINSLDEVRPGFPGLLELRDFLRLVILFGGRLYVLCFTGDFLRLVNFLALLKKHLFELPVVLVRLGDGYATPVDGQLLLGHY